MAITSSSSSNNLYGYLMSQSTGTSLTEFENQLRLRALYEGAQNRQQYVQSGSGASSPLATPQEKEAQPNPVLLLLEDL